MSTDVRNIRAVFEKGIFRPLEPVNLPENTEVEIIAQAADGQDAAWNEIYETLSARFRGGDPKVAERHNEHQP